MPIKSEHVRQDLDEIKRKGDKATILDVIQVIGLVAKIALDIRQNQVAFMNHKGIPLSTRRENTPKKDS